MVYRHGYNVIGPTMKSLRLLPRLCAALATAWVAGCNPPQPLNFSVQNVTASTTGIDADLKDVTVTPGAPNERTGSLPPAVANLTPTWKEATVEALARAAIFDDDSLRHVNLEVKVLKFDAPGLGFTFPTYTDARYTLVDRKTGDVLFSQIISGEGTTPMDYAFVGAIRARESINRSAQNNIGNFVEALEHSTLAKPRNAVPTSASSPPRYRSPGETRVSETDAKQGSASF